MRSIVGISAAVFLIAAPAHADWSYTRWGMTPAQVIAASGGLAHPYSPAEVKGKSTFKGQSCQAGYDGYAVGPYVFSVSFCFDGSNRLSSVLLDAPEDKFYALNRDLRGTFGAPVQEHGGMLPSAIWNDRAHGNTLRLIRVAGTVLEYKPIVSGF